MGSRATLQVIGLVWTIPVTPIALYARYKALRHEEVIRMYFFPVNSLNFAFNLSSASLQMMVLIRS